MSASRFDCNHILPKLVALVCKKIPVKPGVGPIASVRSAGNANAVNSGFREGERFSRSLTSG